MGAMSVGTTGISERQKQKWHCLCVLESGAEAYITVKAYDKAGAGKMVHTHYKGVEYVIDIYTPQEMERKKSHLRKSIVSGIALH